MRKEAAFRFDDRELRDLSMPLPTILVPVGSIRDLPGLLDCLASSRMKAITGI